LIAIDRFVIAITSSEAVVRHDVGMRRGWAGWRGDQNDQARQTRRARFRCDGWLLVHRCADLECLCVL